MLKSDTIRLRAIEPEDLDLMYVVENDTELWPLGQASVPFSHYALKQYVIENEGDIFRDRQLRLTIETNDGNSVGFIDLQNYEPLHQRAEVGIVVVPEYQQRGIATEALRLLADYASNRLGIHQLYALVPASNEASLALFRKCGYKETATLQDWLKSPQGWQLVLIVQKILTH